MAQVKVTNDPQGRPNGGLLGGWTTRIEVAGRELNDVLDATLRFPVSGPVELHVEQQVSKPFEFAGEADVHLHLHLPEGCRLIETTMMSTDGREYHVVRVLADV